MLYETVRRLGSLYLSKERITHLCATGCVIARECSVMIGIVPVRCGNFENEIVSINGKCGSLPEMPRHFAGTIDKFFYLKLSASQRYILAFAR